jgi:hypothetical protein
MPSMNPCVTDVHVLCQKHLRCNTRKWCLDVPPRPRQKPASKGAVQHSPSETLLGKASKPSLSWNLQEPCWERHPIPLGQAAGSVSRQTPNNSRPAACRSHVSQITETSSRQAAGSVSRQTPNNSRPAACRSHVSQTTETSSRQAAGSMRQSTSSLEGWIHLGVDEHQLLNRFWVRECKIKRHAAAKACAEQHHGPPDLQLHKHCP